MIEEDDGDEGPATAVDADGEKHEIRWPRNAKLLDVLSTRASTRRSPAAKVTAACAGTEERRGRDERQRRTEQQDLDEA